MRLVFFGMDGPLSVQALRAMGGDHEVVGVVRAIRRPEVTAPRPTARAVLSRAARALGWRRTPALARVAASLRAPAWETRAGNDPQLAERIAAVRPDLICIAGFPWLLGPELLAIPSAGAVNAHSALLPRHRGPLPLFWIYYHDDRETGVTVHRVTEAADAGDILSQTTFPLPRGFPVETLNLMNAERGAQLLRSTLRALQAGREPGTPQDAARATLAPMVRAGTPMVDFTNWDVERVWHFLAGLFPRFLEPLHSHEGTTIRYDGVRGYRREGHDRIPGSLVRTAGGYDIYCSAGSVQLRASA